MPAKVLEGKCYASNSSNFSETGRKKPPMVKMLCKY